MGGTAYKGAFEVEMAQHWGVEVVVVPRRGRGCVALSQRWA
ncbi:MAG: hypothetical protein NZM10_06995 [Fimbriimonadales bacterium]|nr:hypothetical protein [Fimbriimonadales bacterium]